MYDLIAQPLSWFYNIWPSYAGAITLLTLSIMVVLTPLTLKGTRSMLAMQRLQPEMKRLQAKHKDDRQKLNEEMLKFYKEHGINPVSGCLPLLLQMPVFFFLYRTLLGLISRAPYGGDMGAATARAAGRTGASFSQFGVFFPKHLNKSSKLYQSLHSTRQMRSWGLNLADSASHSISKGIGHAAPFIVLVLLVAATSYIQQKQVAGRSPQAAQANPQQQMLLKLMPGFALISLTLPAGIVLYFFVSNLYRIGQQAFITRTMYHEGGPLTATAVESEQGGKSKVEPAPLAVGAGPPRKGLLGMLTAAREPQAAETRPTSTGSGGRAPSRATPGKPSRAGQTSGRSGSSKIVKPTSNGAAAKPSPGTAPSRQRPPAPVNRSRAKKKRK